MKRANSMLWHLVAYVLLAVSQQSVNGLSPTTSGTYVAVAPQLLRPGNEYDVSVTILTSSGPVTVTASLQDNINEDNVTVVANHTSITSGSTGIIKLQIPTELEQDRYMLVVKGTGGGVSFTDSTYSIDVQTKSLSCFIQTDKATYKPGEKVRFRAITVYMDLKPYKGDISVSVSDPAGNKIAEWLDQRNDTGVFTGSLQLSDQPPLGTWSINVVTQDDTVMKKIDVATYVLPKYEVTVTLPPHYLVMLNRRQAQQDLCFTVRARYTYGQPVKGQAMLNISVVAYYRSPSKSMLKTVQLTNGSAAVCVKISQLVALAPVYEWQTDQWLTLSDQSILVVADVTESLTGTVLSGNSTVQCTSDKYRLTFLDTTPSSFKPGLTFTAFLQLSQYDGTAPLASDIQSQKVAITTNFNYARDISYEMQCTATVITTLVTVPLSGFITFSLDIESSVTDIRISATFHDTSSNGSVSAYTYAYVFDSRDGEGFQIALDNNSAGVLTAGQTASFTVKSTASFTTFYYQLLSKAVLVKSAVVTGSQSNTHSLSLVIDNQLAQKLAPSARIVAWYITAHGEVVSDSLDFTVNGAFANQVSVSFDQTTVEPEDTVTITVNAYQGSYVGLLAVDQSVLLLKSGNDVTQSTVIDELQNYDRYYSSGGSDSTAVFRYAGLAVMTDAFIYTYYYGGNGGNGGNKNGGSGGAAGGDGNNGNSGERGPDSSSTVRKNFPETWIWSDETIGPNGDVSLSATVPDTITSWVLSAFAVSSDVGLGIAPTTAQVTVFKPFFISLNLPYSVVRGEQFVLQVNVFNYKSINVTASVTLQRSDRFKVKVSSNALPSNTASSVSIQIPSMDAATASFWIVADTLGQIPIDVQAQSTTAADAVSIPLLVVAEGVPQQYSTSVFINLSPGQTYSNVLNVLLPTVGLVPDSQYIEVTAIGNLLGQSLNGLADLLQMPYGCGEQNMLNFAPDVYVLKYLETTGQSDNSVTDEAMQFINTGYQRQLTYQRSDGSYSAFGDSDPSGSVWLSAFVIKCFHEAKDFIPIDDLQLAVTLNWLLGGQSRNGSFFEPPNGRVIHTDMQGGSAKGVALTAYVLISLIENANNTAVDQSRYVSAKTRAVQYLESQFTLVTNDPYSLSIICYALTVANSSRASAALQLLNSLAIIKDGTKHWHKNNADDAATSNQGAFVFVPPYQQSPSLDIETTAYALLTYAHLGDLTGGIPIAKWIVAQRNANGGFSSTQDTVVALQALTEFAALTSGNSNQQQLSISLTAGGQLYNFQTVTPTNALVLQAIEIPSTARSVTLNAGGSGVALIQLNVKYNVNASVLATSTKVQVTVNTTSAGISKLSSSSGITKFSLGACASWNGTSASGMAVIEVGLPSGYSTNGEITPVGLVRRVDQDDDKIVFYLDRLNTKQTCVNVTLSQSIVVANVQPTTVRAYLYYNKKQMKTLSVKPPVGRGALTTTMTTKRTTTKSTLKTTTSPKKTTKRSARKTTTTTKAPKKG